MIHMVVLMQSNSTIIWKIKFRNKSLARKAYQGLSQSRQKDFKCEEASWPSLDKIPLRV